MSTLNEIYLELLEAQKDAAIEKDINLKSVELCILFINGLRKCYEDNTVEWSMDLDLHPDTMMSLALRKGKESMVLCFKDNSTVVYAFVNMKTDEKHRGHFPFPLNKSASIPKNIIELIDRFISPKSAALTCPIQCGLTYASDNIS